MALPLHKTSQQMLRLRLRRNLLARTKLHGV
jgi:hypothetical protein